MQEVTHQQPNGPTPVAYDAHAAIAQLLARAALDYATQQPWPEGVHVRYRTVGGATVDVRGSHDAASYKCWGCGDSTALYGDRRTRELAQGHAEKWRALPRPQET